VHVCSCTTAHHWDSRNARNGDNRSFCACANGGDGERVGDPWGPPRVLPAGTDRESFEKPLSNCLRPIAKSKLCTVSPEGVLISRYLLTSHTPMFKIRTTRVELSHLASRLNGLSPHSGFFALRVAGPDPETGHPGQR
jgi:hypothetical protein